MSKVIGVKLNDADLALWTAKAESKRLTLPQWLRSLAEDAVDSKEPELKVNPAKQKVNLKARGTQKVNLSSDCVDIGSGMLNPVHRPMSLKARMAGVSVLEEGG